MNLPFLVACIIFGISLLLLAHTYAIYPVLMRFLARGRSLPSSAWLDGDELPEVAVLMAVYNEESVLEETISSILASDYPAEKVRIYVGSDGSTDSSDQIIRDFAREDRRLRLVQFGGRNGKIRIINHLAEGVMSTFTDSENALFVLCDANVVWRPDLLRRLARHFGRESVGLVGSAVVDRVAGRNGIGEQEESYIGQENRIKYSEGVLWGRIMGAFGACYAMRARLFQPVPPRYIVDDFYLTMACLEQGSDAIVDLEAISHEAVSTDIREEFRRKRRIATGNFQNLAHFWSFLLPWNGGPATSFAFWSHKGLRWCGPLLILAAFCACLVMLAIQPLHPISLLGLGGFLAAGTMAGVDFLLYRTNQRQVKLFRFVRYFLSMNAALFLGLIDFLRGPRNSVWEPTRREGGGSQVSSENAASCEIHLDEENRKPKPALQR